MGHSAPRASYEDAPGEGVAGKIQKRLELLPEEAIYLVERGSMLCWKASPTGESYTPEMISAVYGAPIPGVPMSVQQVYTEMIGREDLTVEKLLVRLSLLPFFSQLIPLWTGVHIFETFRICCHAC